MNSERGIGKFFRPITNPEEWKQLLADPDKHWKTGHSAKALAYCWQEATDFPQSVKRVFKNSGLELFQNTELLMGLPEYRVPLPGGKRASQNDIFLLAKGNSRLISIAVEGKAGESFGKVVADWKLRDRGGKKRRLSFLCRELQLDENAVDHIRYQLLHRTASAVIQAKRFRAENALMLVHSFSRTKYQEDEAFQDYCQFLKLFAIKGRQNFLSFAKNINGIDLYFGWIKGEKKYLKK